MGFIALGIVFRVCSRWMYLISVESNQNGETKPEFVFELKLKFNKCINGLNMPDLILKNLFTLRQIYLT